MKLNTTAIDGVFVIENFNATDIRGVFVKEFQKSAFTEHGLRSDFKEEYYSVSEKNVIRGMHFQAPPAQHVKLVSLIRGAIRDVILDLRKGSPTYGKFTALDLDAGSCVSVYIPEGLAHGFMALSKDTIVGYKVTSEYCPQFDKGIHWNSFGYDWGMDNPVVSDRDNLFPSLEQVLAENYF